MTPLPDTRTPERHRAPATDGSPLARMLAAAALRAEADRLTAESTLCRSVATMLEDARNPPVRIAGDERTRRRR